MQYNNMLALFDNWDMYSRAIETSTNAMGTLQDQQDIYMQSTAAHLKELRAETENLYASLFNADDFKFLPHPTNVKTISIIIVLINIFFIYTTSFVITYIQQLVIL